MATMLCFSALFFMVIVGNVGAQRGGNNNNNSPQVACTPPILTLSPCITYLVPPPFNFSVTPAAQCCSALATVISSNMGCLCTLFLPNNPLGVSFNKTQALTLPSACKLTPPQPLVQCTTSGNAASPPQDSTPPVNNTVPPPSSQGNLRAIPPSTPTSVSPPRKAPQKSPPAPPASGVSACDSPPLLMFLMTVGMLMAI